jgi:hypothetical protein
MNDSDERRRGTAWDEHNLEHFLYFRSLTLREKLGRSKEWATWCAGSAKCAREASSVSRGSHG